MSKIYLKCIVYSLCLLSFFGSFAQGTSNKGTDFWLGYGKHTSVGNMVLYLTSDVNTTATVSINSLGFTKTVDILANAVIAVDIPTNAHLNVEGLSANGIHVTSLKPIIVYAHIYQSSVSGATLVLPVNTLGKDYYSINYKQFSNSNGAVSWFFVVAVEDGTKVEITPSANTSKGWMANNTYTVDLNKGEIYNVLGTFTNVSANSSGVDLTGSRVKSVSSNGTCKKIAVFSGSSKISINCFNYSLPTAPGSADNLFQQAYPTSAWGKNFITVPQKERDFVIYRIVKSDPTAVVELNGNVIPSGSFVNDFYYDFASKQVDQITSDKPIQAVQYAVTQNKTLDCRGTSGDIGDPEMIFLNPLEQTLTQITMYSTPRYSIFKHFINVVIKNSGVANFKLDGVNSSSSFSPVPSNTAYSYAQFSVSEGTHNLISDEGFNAIAYGFGNNDSYGYAAGANLTSFGVESVNSTTFSDAQTGCVGTNYDLRLNLPYQAVDIYLDKGDGSGYKNIPVSLISQNTKDDVTTYTYNVLKEITSNKDTTLAYKVKAIKPTIDDCGTGDEFNFDFIINEKPIAEFSLAAKSCLKSPIDFLYTNSTNQTIANYLWDFNGEASANTANPQYTFIKSGVKKIRLSVKSSNGCWSDVLEKEIEVVPLPIANFMFDAVTCVNNQISFTNQSTTVEGNIVNWDWDFGDPSSSTNFSTQQNPTHVFSALKTYDIKLTVTTDIGCIATITKQITINPVPIVDFDTPDICLNDASALFSNKSTVSDNSTLTYVWDFGDPSSGANNTSTLKSPTHRYTKAQDYDVKLTTTTAKGCAITIAKNFTVNGSTPKADFVVQNSNNLCSNQVVNFTDNASVDFGEITKIEWIYDDLTPAVMETDDSPNLRSSSKKVYSHTYPTFYKPAQRNVTVTMRAYSGLTCVNTTQKVITLQAIPEVNFSLPKGCLVDGKATFNNLSTFNGAESGLTYLWDFGDGNPTSTEKSPTHQFLSAKDFQVSLTVTASNGCSATLKKTFTVNGAIANPQFNVLNANSLCSDFQVTFQDKAQLSFGELNKIEWDFDVDNEANNPAFHMVDNNPAQRSETSKSYIFTYPSFHSPISKAINVRMKTTSGNNCESEIIKTITLKAVPNVVFNPINGVCAEVLPYKITAASEVSGFSGVGEYSGKGITSNGFFSPEIAGVGKHTITYTFTGNNNCVSIKTQDIEVYETPKLDAGVDKIILLGGEIVLDAIASGKNLSYKWTPATGLSKDDVLNPIASPKKDINYTLIITSEEGCSVADEVFVKVLQFPEIPNTFTPNGDGVNDTWNIKYLNSYPNASIKIFNRYGKEVFKANNYATPWDGKFNNEYLPEGMYYYVITAKDGELKYSGSVMLVK